MNTISTIPLVIAFVESNLNSRSSEVIDYLKEIAVASRIAPKGICVVDYQDVLDSIVDGLLDITDPGEAFVLKHKTAQDFEMVNADWTVNYIKKKLRFAENGVLYICRNIRQEREVKYLSAIGCVFVASVADDGAANFDKNLPTLRNDKSELLLTVDTKVAEDIKLRTDAKSNGIVCKAEDIPLSTAFAICDLLARRITPK